MVFCRERHLVKAEISVHAGRGLSVQSGGEAEDPYVAFDGAAERIDKRLRRHKRRLKNHHARAKDGAAPPTQQDATAYVLAADERDGEIEGERRGRRRGRAARHRRDAHAAAAAQRQRSGDAARPHRPSVLLFRNSARGNLNLIYRRPDGNIGWIDPDLAERGALRGAKAQ